MMRPKSKNIGLPPRLQPVTRTLKSGKVWTSYYYNGRDENGKRKMIPLGEDLDAAKRKWPGRFAVFRSVTLDRRRHQK